MRAHFDVVTVVVDHADKLAELSWSGRRTKTEDGFDFLRLRLDSIGSDNMAEVFNLFDGEETFIGPDREIGAIQTFETNLDVLHVVREATGGENGNIIDKAFNIRKIGGS